MTPADISLTVTAASVNVVATVTAASASEASAMSSTLGALDTTSASTQLGVTVESVSTPSVVETIIPAPSPPPPTTCLTLEVQTDEYPGDLSWYLAEATGDGTKVEQREAGSYTAASTMTTESFCLPNGDYVFNITDAYGDGMVYNGAAGFYMLYTSDGLHTLAWHSGEFGSEVTALSLPITKRDSNCVQIEVLTDAYPEDSAWTLEDADGNLIGQRSAGSFTESHALYLDELCLPDGVYNVTFSDDFGDGFNYGDDPNDHGYYAIREGSDFVVASETEDFTTSSEIITLPYYAPPHGPSAPAPPPVPPETPAPAPPSSPLPSFCITVEVRTDAYHRGSEAR